jgi:hypothetical protein
MVKKEAQIMPPKNMEEKFEIIMAGKKGPVGKLLSAAKGAFGLKP